MMGKDILILSNSIRGIHSFRKEVVKAILDKGYEITISVPDIQDEKAEYFKEIGCHLIKSSLSRRGTNPMSDFNLMMSYRSLIKRLKPIAILTYTIKANIYGGIAARLCRIPQIANVTGLGDALENGGWMQKLTTILYRIGIEKARNVFFQNNSNREVFIKYRIVGENSRLLPGSGVNLQHHTYQEYPADDVNVRFLFIGRLLKDKGIEEYFEMIKAIKSKYPNTEFQIVGRVEGEYEDRLKEMTEAGMVDFLGLQYDVRPFIGSVHCTIMPSYHEGMSNVNLESAANGRPIITSDVPGCRETVDDSRTGFLCEARSAECLTEAVERFLALPYEKKKQMGENGRRKVEKEFDRQIVVDAYLAAIEKLHHV